MGESDDWAAALIGENEILVLYIAEAEGRTGKNKPALYYSIYSGSGWSAPVILEDDGTADANVFVYDIGDGRVFVAWSSADKVHAENVSDDDFLNSFNIQSAFFDKASKSFGAVSQVTKTTDSGDYYYGSFGVLTLKDNYEDVPAEAFYDSKTKKLCFIYYKNEFQNSKEIYSTFGCLFYDDTLGRWLNTPGDYSDEEKNLHKQNYEGNEELTEKYLNTWYHQTFLSGIIIPDGREFIEISGHEQYAYETSQNGKSFLQLAELAFCGVSKGYSVGFLTYDSDTGVWKSTDVAFSERKYISSKFCFDGSKGIFFLGLPDENGEGGTIECYSFYCEERSDPGYKYKKMLPRDETGKWLSDKIMTVHTDNINNYLLFEDGENKYLVYSESDEGGAEIRAIKLSQTGEGTEISTSCSSCEFVIARAEGEGEQYEIIPNYGTKGNIDFSLQAKRRGDTEN